MRVVRLCSACQCSQSTLLIDGYPHCRACALESQRESRRRADELEARDLRRHADAILGAIHPITSIERRGWRD